MVRVLVFVLVFQFKLIFWLLGLSILNLVGFSMWNNSIFIINY